MIVVNKILEKGKYGTKLEDRTKIMSITSAVGLFLNILLSLIKFILFILTGSVSILADAINNLTDSISSIVTIVGMRMAKRPADKEHPYGHGRIEYMVTLIVASFLLFAGFEFIKISIDRVLNPKEVNYSYISIILMTLSIVVKLYMGRMYRKISKKISSKTMEAQAADSFADVNITTVVVVSIIIYKYTNFIIDGYVGFIVSLLILKSGFELVRETISEIIGEAPNEDIYEKIDEITSGYEKILGIHDIIITSYGPDKNYISFDVEVPYDMTLVEAHDLIDIVERRIERELNCETIIHIDPIGIYDTIEKEIYKRLTGIVRTNKDIFSFHDLKRKGNNIMVEIAVDGNLISKEEEIKRLKKYIVNEIKINENFNYEIEIDRVFIVEEK